MMTAPCLAAQGDTLRHLVKTDPDPQVRRRAQSLLDDALQRGPDAYGWPISTWSIRDLLALLHQERQVEVSVYTVHRAVRGLGYRYRRPRHDLKHRQDAEAVAFAQQAVAWLGKGPRRARRRPPGRSRRMRIHRHPHLRQMWQRRGTSVRVPAAGEDARFMVYGALDYASGHLAWQTAATKDAATFVAFLDHLEAAWPTGQVLIVLDNAGYHKGHVAAKWWAAHGDRIRPLWCHPTVRSSTSWSACGGTSRTRSPTIAGGLICPGWNTSRPPSSRTRRHISTNSTAFPSDRSTTSAKLLSPGCRLRQRAGMMP